MVKRKQYEDTKFHFITTTDPYATPSKDVQTFIRRQAMKDAGIQRRIRNKQRREKSESHGTSSPPEQPWNEEKSRPRQMPVISLADINETSGPLVSNLDLQLSSHALPFPSPSYGWVSEEVALDENHGYQTSLILPSASSYSIIRMDPLNMFPIEMDENTHRIFQFALSSLERLPNIRRWWLNAAFEDAAMFRQKLSISAQLCGLRKGLVGQKDLDLGRKDLDLSWRLSDAAIRDVNRRLQHPTQRTSNGVLSTIIALTYGKLDDRFVLRGWWIHLSDENDWAHHLRAAHDIIERRGGVDNINSLPLRQEIYWIDLITSVHHDEVTRYPLPEGIAMGFQATLERARSAYHYWSGFIWSKGPGHLRPILQLLDEMKCIIAARRNECRENGMEPWQDGGFTADWVNPMTHQLCNSFLNRPKTNDSRHTQAFEALRLTMLLYTFAIRALPGNNQRPQTAQDRKLKIILRNAGHCMWVEKPELGLWVLGVLSLSCDNEKEKEWLCTSIRITARRLNIFATEQLLSCLHEIAWEKEFSRVVLDSVWTCPREFIDITEQSFSVRSYFEPELTPIHTSSTAEGYYSILGNA